MVNVDLYSAIITKVSNALDTLVSGEKPGFQSLSEGLVVLLCAEVVRQNVGLQSITGRFCGRFSIFQDENTLTLRTVRLQTKTVLTSLCSASYVS